MMRSRFLALGAVGVVLAGCTWSEAEAEPATPPPVDVPGSATREFPVPDVPTRLEPDCPAPDPSDTFTPAQLERALIEVELPAWESGDVGVSVELTDGRFVWLYADTVRPPGPGLRLIGNSILVTSGTCISQVVREDKGPIVPDAASEDEADATSENPFNDVIHWPMSVVRVPTPAGYPADVDVLVALYNRVQRGVGAWDFLVRGSTMVVFTVAPGGVPQVDRILELTADDLDANHVTWGAAAEMDGDWLYIYGTRTTGELYVYGRELYVSRRPVGAPTDPDGWEFWDGSTWQPDRARIAPVMGALDGPSQTLTIDIINGRWTAVSKRGGDLFDEVWMWTSDSPTGPWEGQAVLDVPSGFDTPDLTYLPLAHPEVPLTSGGLLITVSRNVSEFTRLLADTTLGRPLYAEVPRP